MEARGCCGWAATFPAAPCCTGLLVQMARGSYAQVRGSALLTCSAMPAQAASNDLRPHRARFAIAASTVRSSTCWALQQSHESQMCPDTAFVTPVGQRHRPLEATRLLTAKAVCMLGTPTPETSWAAAADALEPAPAEAPQAVPLNLMLVVM